MTVIEKHIHEHFAKLAAEGQTEEPTTNGVHQNGDLPIFPPAVPTLRAPFAKVNRVEPGSPADDAGLKANDEVRNFGYVDIGNHDGLRRVGECVQGNEGVRSINQLAKRLLNLVYSMLFL